MTDPTTPADALGVAMRSLHPRLWTTRNIVAALPEGWVLMNVDSLAAALHFNGDVWGRPTPCEGWSEYCDTCQPAAAAIIQAAKEEAERE